MGDLDATRRRYAELVRERGSIGSVRPFSERLFRAFAEVPRERYLGPGPWKISRPTDPWTKIETPDDNPERIYDDVLVSIVAEKGLANGLPSAHARWLNALDLSPGDQVLHCGCGRLIFPMVRYPRGGESWIANARTGKRDLETGMGLMLRIQRTAAGYATAVVSPVVFFPCFGAIDSDPEADPILAEALRSGAIAQAKSMRCEPHERDASCLVHIQRYCFSRLG